MKQQMGLCIFAKVPLPLTDTLTHLSSCWRGRIFKEEGPKWK